MVITVLSVSKWRECAAMRWKRFLGGSVTPVYLSVVMAESEAMEAIHEND